MSRQKSHTSFDFRDQFSEDSDEDEQPQSEEEEEEEENNESSSSGFSEEDEDEISKRVKKLVSKIRQNRQKCSFFWRQHTPHQEEEEAEPEERFEQWRIPSRIQPEDWSQIRDWGPGLRSMEHALHSSEKNKGRTSSSSSSHRQKSKKKLDSSRDRHHHGQRELMEFETPIPLALKMLGFEGPDQEMDRVRRKPLLPSPLACEQQKTPRDLIVLHASSSKTKDEEQKDEKEESSSSSSSSTPMKMIPSDQ